MSRGGSFGGGQSSLGYLFGSENEIPKTPDPPVAPKPAPPYGIDSTEEDDKADKKPKISNNHYQRAQSQNSGNFVTDRPTTKVNSVPGGSSSLGYLFGDK